MKTRPILFNAEMVRAILDGRKTQTRRPMKPQPTPIKDSPGGWEKRYPDGHVFPFWDGTAGSTDTRHHNVWPSGQAGDRLWVRETWAEMCRADAECHCENGFPENGDHYIEYRASSKDKRPGGWPDPSDDEFQDAPRWRPSIHMPRWASRIQLEITAVRVERLKEISEEDARAEGVKPVEVDATDQSGKPVPPNHALGFMWLWDLVYSEQGLGWEHNPWVWVVEFRRVQP